MYATKTQRDSLTVEDCPHLEGWPALLWFHGDCRSLDAERRLHDCGLRPVFSLVAHQPSGQPFMLASMPDGPLLAVAPAAASAILMVSYVEAWWTNPVRWASMQRWAAAPTTPECRAGGAA